MYLPIIIVLLIVIIYLYTQNSKLQEEERIGFKYRTSNENVKIIAGELNKLMDLVQVPPCKVSSVMLKKLEENRDMIGQVGSNVPCSVIADEVDKRHSDLVQAINNFYNPNAEDPVELDPETKALLQLIDAKHVIAISEQSTKLLKVILYSSCDDKGRINFDKALQLLTEIHNSFCS